MSAYWFDLESELNMEFSDDDIKIFLDIGSRSEQKFDWLLVCYDTMMQALLWYTRSLMKFS
jgi:hypothetical protein